MSKKETISTEVLLQKMAAATTVSAYIALRNKYSLAKAKLEKPAFASKSTFHSITSYNVSHLSI